MAINRDKYNALHQKLEIARSQLPSNDKFSIDIDGGLCMEDGTQVIAAEEIDEVFALLAAWVGKK